MNDSAPHLDSSESQPQFESPHHQLKNDSDSLLASAETQANEPAVSTPESQPAQTVATPEHSSQTAKTTALRLAAKVGLVACFYGLMVLKGWGYLDTQWQLYGLLLVGLVFGLMVPFLDETVFIRYYREATNTVTRLATQSTVFILVLIPLSLYVITSTGSPLSVGVMLGLVSSTVVDMLFLFKQPEQFRATYLYQFRRSFTQRDTQVVAIGSLIWLVILWVLAVAH